MLLTSDVGTCIAYKVSLCTDKTNKVRMGKTVSAFDSSASWVGVSRCEIKSSNILMSFSTLYHELVCHVEHFSVELDTLHQHMT